MTEKIDSIFKLSEDHQRILATLRDAKEGFRIIHSTTDELLLFELQEQGMADVVVVDPQKYPTCWYLTPHGRDTLTNGQE